MDKPDVDFIEGLSPAISIDQKSASRNPRSTVGTITEVYDYLRLLYARIGMPHCPNCGRPVARQSPQQIVDRVLDLADGTRFLVLAPVVRGRKGEYDALLDELAAQGFARARVDGTAHRARPSARSIDLARYEQHTIEVVVDRLVRRDGIERRLTESIETALRLGRGRRRDPGRRRTDEMPHVLPAPRLHHCGISFEDPAPRNFSFNSPYGACPVCAGLGTRFEVDPDLVVPEPGALARDGAHRAVGRRAQRVLRPAARAPSPSLRRFDARHAVVEARRRPSRSWSSTARATSQVHVSYRNRYGTPRSLRHDLRGHRPLARAAPRRGRRRTGRASRSRATCARCPCPTCEGARLKPESLAVTVGGMNIAELCALPIGEAVEGVSARSSSPSREAMIAERVLKEIRERMQFLLDVGLDYLTLGRAAATLAGGEAQRIRLASQIGSGLVGRALRARRAVDRAAPAGQPAPDRDAGAAARPRQHGDRRRARRGDDPRRRPRRRHRARARASTAARSSTPDRSPGLLERPRGRSPASTSRAR